MKLVMGLLVSLLITACGSGGESFIEWNVYEGEIPGYTVEIDEIRYSNGHTRRLVYVNSIEAREMGCTSGCSIVGHDYDGTFTGTSDWDRIFRCGYPDLSNGCNSIIFYSDGSNAWYPALGDEDKVGLEHIFREALPEAQRLLAEAMVKIYNFDHLTPAQEATEG